MHLENSILIPYNDLEERYKELNADKNTEIVIYCRTDDRSAIAAQILAKLGYKNIIYVLGGTIEWEENGYPVSE